MNRRLWHQLYTLLGYLTLQTSAMMMIRGQESHGLWWQRHSGGSRPDIVEFWGGHMEISYQATRQGWYGMQPYDLMYGVDLRDPAERARALDDLDRWQPRLAICEFPCRLWTTLTNLNYKGPEGKARLEELREKERVFLEFTEEVFRRQMARGDEALLEQPLRSAARREDPIV